MSIKTLVQEDKVTVGVWDDSQLITTIAADNTVIQVPTRLFLGTLELATQRFNAANSLTDYYNNLMTTLDPNNTRYDKILTIIQNFQDRLDKQTTILNAVTTALGQ